ncbi:MAG: binding-protein-dependent transport system inner rane component [Herbinix sp.]|jgi:NitT/TauT family transport system permease protein|nr:binding-protein-dependent transport system inner rane component [Herbinix sp.]
MGKSKIAYIRNLCRKSLAILFWLFLWEIISRCVNQEILLVSPVIVLSTIVELSKDLSFWGTILFSSGRILVGFIMAIVVGVLMAILSYGSEFLKELITPLMKVIKAAPVASFIILALIWIRAKNLSVLISFLMVIPMIYSNVLQGLYQTDRKLLEMAKVFRIGKLRQVKTIYLPAVMPYFASACSVGLGFSFKAGIAAEVIGIPSGSIGERLYEAKLYFMTKELLAWSIIIIIVSMVFEKLVMLLFGKLPFAAKNTKESD